MPSLDEVHEMIRGLGKDVDTFGTKKEIKYLPEILQPQEKILYITSGLMNGNTWLITCTCRRVIFLDKGMLYGLKQVETPLDKINSIEHKTGMLFGEISIWDGSGKMIIKNVVKHTVTPFVSALNKAIQNTKNTSSADSGDIVAQLSGLAALVEKGILTQEEFQTRKTKILETL